jgi:DNA-directed RNA polymerase subunit M/transcription elongation factor TFIIS
MIAEQLKLLKAKRTELMREVGKVELQIVALRKKCPHDSVDKSADWELDQVPSEDYEEIRERRLTCRDCGHTWTEQRYAYSGEPWPYDCGEWE